MRSGLAALVALFVLLGLGCAEAPEDAALDSPIAIAPIPSFEVPEWRGVPPANDPVVATVEGTPITRSLLEREVARSAPGTDPRAVLERLIELELLARSAKAAGRYTPEVVGAAVQRARVRRFVEQEFDERLTLGDVPSDMVTTAYRVARSRYSHFEVFMIVDVQLLCCSNENPDACFKDDFGDIEARRAQHAACFADSEPVWQDLRKRIESSKVRGELRLRAESAFLDTPSPEMRATYHLDPKVHEYEFQYDTESTYEKQFEKITYPVFYKGIMDGVRDAWIAAGRKVPFLTPVIRSPLGYHLLFIDNVLPRRQQAESDPAVQAELRERLFTEFRTGRFKEFADALAKATPTEVFPERLVPLQDAEAGH